MSISTTLLALFQGNAATAVQCSPARSGLAKTDGRGGRTLAGITAWFGRGGARAGGGTTRWVGGPRYSLALERVPSLDEFA